jgi:soluble cytochrome b562
MPTYVVTAPDGKEYEITAPEGATQEQVLAYAQQNYSKPAEKPQRSLAQEAGRQLGLTARAGITGLAAVPAMLAEPVAAGVNLLAGKQVMASPTQGLQNVLTAAGLPEPETGLERAVQTGTAAMAGVPAQAALSGTSAALAPLRQNLLQQTAAAGAGGVAGQAAADVVQEATDNPLMSAIAGIAAGTVAGAGAAKGATAAATKREPLITLDEIKQRAQRSYATVDQQGVFLKPKSVLDNFNNVESALIKENFNPKLDAHKPVAQVLEQVRDMVGTQRVSFTKLEQMRSALVDLKSAKDSATRKYAGQAVSELDNYITKLGSKDVLASEGDVGKAVKAVQDARKDWRNLSRATVLEDALNVAEARALDPKASEGELIRRQLINLAANKDKMRFFSEREKNAIKSVASGPVGDPLLSLVARLNPERSALMQASTVAGSFANPAAAATVAGLGYGADKLQGALRQRGVNRLMSDIASGQLPQVPPNMAWRGMLSGVPMNPQDNQ